MALQQRCSENTPVHPGKLGSYSSAVCLANTSPQVARAQSRPLGGMAFRAFASPEFCSDLLVPRVTRYPGGETTYVAPALYWLWVQDFQEELNGYPRILGPNALRWLTRTPTWREESQ